MIREIEHRDFMTKKKWNFYLSSSLSLCTFSELFLLFSLSPAIIFSFFLSPFLSFASFRTSSSISTARYVYERLRTGERREERFSSIFFLFREMFFRLFFKKDRRMIETLPATCLYALLLRKRYLSRYMKGRERERDKTEDFLQPDHSSLAPSCISEGWWSDAPPELLLPLCSPACFFAISFIRKELIRQQGMNRNMYPCMHAWRVTHLAREENEPPKKRRVMKESKA